MNPRLIVGYWLITSFTICCFISNFVQAQWPMYRGDAQRSGYTPGPIQTPLTLAWHDQAAHKPDPAWPRSDRQTFDWSLQPVSVDNDVYWGDSVTGELNCVELSSGISKWQYFCEGPIRLAPVVFDDLVIVNSDDGCLHAVERASGELKWKHCGVPDHSLRLGNQRMISRWPSRGGSVISDGVLYYAAGIWPSEGIFLFALDPKTGRELWVNDDSGGIYMPQPHGGAEAESGVAAQGHLAASIAKPTTNSEGTDKALLLVPTGRAVPAVFDRNDGKFKYFHLQKFGQKGGASVSANENFFANSGMIFDLKSGEAAHTIGNAPVAMIPDGMVTYVDKLLTSYRWQMVEKVDRKGAKQNVLSPVPQWSVAGLSPPREIIVAGDHVIVGASGEIVIVDATSQQIVWRETVEGNILSLAVNNGRLIAANDQGSVFCFAPKGLEQTARDVNVAREGANAKTPSTSVTNPSMEKVAQQMIQMADFDEGYCLDFGCGDCQLSESLARNSNLHIIAVDSNVDELEAARKRLSKANLLGSRITVLHVKDLRDSGLPSYFANLIVSQQALQQGSESLPSAEVARLTRPYGGVTILGKAESLERTERGPLQGAGEWTHQYATPGNATCSTDEFIQGPLGMLWFRDVDIAMPQRHGRGPGPLFLDGRLYSMGLHELVCVDAYNGRVLWRYSLPDILAAYNGDQLMGTAGTNSIYCVAETGIYVRRAGNCLRIDRKTGQLLAQFDSPVDIHGKPGVWGYIACVNGVLVGSLADPEHIVTFRYLERGGDMSSLLTESKTLFGMHAETGDILWRYDAVSSIRHNAIAIDAQSVYLIDRPQAIEDRTKKAKVENHTAGVLVSLDTKTGVEKWRSTQDVDGTVLALSQDKPVLLMTSQPTRFALESEIAEHLTAINPQNGERLWRRDTKYSSRPMINQGTIYSESGAWDLLSGSPLPFEFKRSYGCGILAGSKHSMVFRSATLGYFDFERQGKVENFGGIRPGCWINAIPAGGLVLMPDASAGCVCSYLNQSWFALQADGVIAPEISQASGRFNMPIQVTLTADQPTDVVRYTLDGSVPNENSSVYQGPVEISQATILKARAYSANGRAGRTIQRHFMVGE